MQGIAEAHPELTVDTDEPAPVYSLLSGLLDGMAAALAPAFQVV